MPRSYPALTTNKNKKLFFWINDNGEKAFDLLKEYGVVPKTIYKTF